MLINDVLNKEELSSLIIGELKQLGVKYRRDKKQKCAQEKCLKKRIFRTHLHMLELTDVVLANGGIVQIPQFVADACQRILEHVGTEGLFRKAGSSSRQKEIRLSLEAGLHLGRAHHVIDVANVLKSFFRELPEPLLPPGIQETLIRSLLIVGDKVKTILMTCLLLPPLTINTLAFFMQFLNTVALNVDENKMSIENLAIIFTPGLMPLTDITGIRFKNHVKVVQILIENAEKIGVLPDKIMEKLHHSMVTLSNDFDKKKKKRRSGSLTRMFNGLKKIVGAIGSSEDLENSLENNPATPCLTKSAKKRKMADAASAFSAKKKKEILGMLPDNAGPLPNTPICPKGTKKRLSLGGRRNIKYSSNFQQEASMERRWSVVGAAWTRKRHNMETVEKDNIKHLSPVLSMPCISDIPNNFPMSKESDHESVKFDIDDPNFDSDYVRIPKSEYEDIKERVTAIETRISQELGNARDSLLHTCISDNDIELRLSGPERVLNKFVKTMEETETMTSPGTEQLAKRLSRELKIRRSGEDRVIRSPSARKIGTIRRRSQENIRLSRNKTWHISSTKCGEEPNHFVSALSVYPKTNLKRGRPNTLNTGLQQPSGAVIKGEISENKSTPIQNEENWTPGEDFFNDIHKQEVDAVVSNTNSENPPKSLPTNNINLTPNLTELSSNGIEIRSATPNFVTKISVNETKTPMLPPRSIPRKSVISKAPSSLPHHDNKMHSDIVQMLPKPVEESQNGRASIARLRAQNAGMVLAKAKLFDGLRTEAEFSKSSVELRRTSNRFVMKELKRHQFNNENKMMDSNVRTDLSTQRTPKRRNPPKSPGCIKKRHKLSLAKCPNRILLESIVDENTILQKNDKLKSTALRNSNVNSPARHTKKMKTSKVNTPRRNSRTPRKQSAISTNASLN